MTENEPKPEAQKKRDFYLRQKELLTTLLEHGAISQAQQSARYKFRCRSRTLGW